MLVNLTGLAGGLKLDNGYASSSTCSLAFRVVKFGVVCQSDLDTRAASWENQQCGFRTGLTQIRLYSHRSRLEVRNFGFK